MSARLIVAASALLTLGAASALAQPPDHDDTLVVATYHKVTREALDVRAAAEASEAAARASSFDRPDVVKAEAARLQALVNGADPNREFVMRVGDNVSVYDHARGQFSVALFEPGHYLPIRLFDGEYRVAFANAASARTIAMPKESARAFDARLEAGARHVVDEIRFRIVGKGDPAGAVTGPRVIRAELIAVRLLDATGAVLYTPNVVAARAPVPTSTVPADVAGLRVGVPVKEMEATLARLYGPVSRGSAGENAHPALGGALEVNSMGCFTLPGRRRNPEPGAVCVTALHDRDDVVRVVRVERLFPPMAAEAFRTALVHRYGPVDGAQEGSSFALGWGPTIDAALRYDRSGPPNALTAHYTTDEDYLSRGLNSAPRIRVVLQLVDARWAAAATP